MKLLLYTFDSTTQYSTFCPQLKLQLYTGNFAHNGSNCHWREMVHILEIMSIWNHFQFWIFCLQHKQLTDSRDFAHSWSLLLIHETTAINRRLYPQLKSKAFFAGRIQESGNHWGSIKLFECAVFLLFPQLLIFDRLYHYHQQQVNKVANTNNSYVELWKVTHTCISHIPRNETVPCRRHHTAWANTTANITANIMSKQTGNILYAGP